MNPDTIKAMYRDLVSQVGEEIFIRRYTGSGTSRPRFDTEVKARAVGYDENELVGTIQQGDRKLIVLAEDLYVGQFPMPVTSNDKVVLRGRELAIMSVDDSTRRVAGMLIALELQCRG